ncbi:MAG: hypothetical protein GOMPHAMPRED_008057 [Gomphillus americanus]|uniref:Mediator of RNA polymerase II transcription subunit 10 n=1 Tax=Gomphillus americanus TaxID=1940652 RepID=A0A8H3EY05_9LECA|nr:MAG: hypothetical protein GOMPHAMPRED_008057 [Gomphillus americanus]
MAPNTQQLLDENLRGTIQDLFSIQSNVHGYQGPATQRALVQNFTSLHVNLERVYSSAQPLASRPIPPEVIEYIDEGRNPDIYTREFVELTQKGNRYLKSKAVAYAQFRDELAKKTIEAWPEMKEAVQRVLEGNGAGVEGLPGMTGGGNVTRLKHSLGDTSVEQNTMVTDSVRPELSTQTDASMHDMTF